MRLHHLSCRSRVMDWSAGLALLVLLCGAPGLQAAEGDDAGRTDSSRADSRDERPSGPKVAVFDFLTNPEDDQIVAALKQQIVRDLRQAGYQPVVKSVKDSQNASQVQAAAKEAGAAYAVSGNVQSALTSVQITGDVHEYKTGLFAPVEVNGPASSYFALQKEFISKVKAALASAEAGEAEAAAKRSATGRERDAAPVIPQANNSHWAGYADDGKAPQVIFSGNPPTPPPPPLYGGYQPPYNYGGGGYFEPGFHSPTPGTLGTTRIEHLGQLGVSIIPRSPLLSQTGRKAPPYQLPPSSKPTPIPEYNRPIQQYKNPHSRFAAPVGQPQRAAPPNLRPGTDGSK